METETVAKVVPIRPAVDLARYSAADLCQAVITLTHQVAGTADLDRADHLREQREHAVRELCRRADR